MKKIKYSIVLVLLVVSATWAQVGIGTPTPVASAALELNSTTQGVLIPRMTQVQMNAIATPATGLNVYCTNCSPIGLYVYNGSTYTAIGPNQSTTLTTLSCGSATHIGTLKAGQLASGVVTSIPYTGGNGAVYSSVSVASTGVTGLTAIASYGTFASGAGSFPLLIFGTPSGTGTATFNITIGGQSCSFTRTVN